jgi:hypothetical protein
MTEIRITHGMVERATCAMIAEMFAPHELPLDDDLWDKYYQTAKVALTAALSEDDIAVRTRQMPEMQFRQLAIGELEEWQVLCILPRLWPCGTVVNS